MSEITFDFSQVNAGSSRYRAFHSSGPGNGAHSQKTAQSQSDARTDRTVSARPRVPQAPIPGTGNQNVNRSSTNRSLNRSVNNSFTAPSTRNQVASGGGVAAHHPRVTLSRPGSREYQPTKSLRPSPSPGASGTKSNLNRSVVA